MATAPRSIMALSSLFGGRGVALRANLRLVLIMFQYCQPALRVWRRTAPAVPAPTLSAGEMLMIDRGRLARSSAPLNSMTFSQTSARQ